MKIQDITLSRILFIALIALLIPLKSIAQCAQVSINVINVKDSPCADNGSLEVVVTGDDITNGNYFDLQYRAYITGTTPTDDKWGNSKIVSGLSPGSYTVDVRGKCKTNQNNYVPKYDAVSGITIGGDWKALNMKLEQSRKAFDCIAPTGSGQITFSGSGGTAPYTLTITKAPATYAGVTSKTYTTEAAIQNEKWDGLPSGEYTFVLTEDSPCDATVTKKITINSLVMAGMPNLFQYFMPYQIAIPVASRENDLEYNSSLSVSWVSMGGTISTIPETHEYYHYAANAHLYFDFAIYYNGQPAPAPNDLSLTWKSLPTYGNTSTVNYLKLKDLAYSIDDMHTNKTYPNLLIRSKTDITCSKTMTATYYAPYRYLYVRGDCSALDFEFQLQKTFYGLYTWPIQSWKVEKMNGTTVEALIKQSTDPIPYNGNGTFKFPIPTESANYRLTITSALGKEYVSLLNYIMQSPSSGVTASSNTRGCNNEMFYPVIYNGNYNSGSQIKITDIKSIKYIKAQKSINGGSTWTEVIVGDPDFTPPNFTEWRPDLLPTDIFDKYKNTAYTHISFWAKEIKESIKTSGTELNNAINSGALAPIVLKNEKTAYKYTFTIEDVCGKSKTFDVTTNSNYYIHTAPNFSSDFNCYDGVTVRINNMTSLIKAEYRANSGSYNQLSYAKIISRTDTDGNIDNTGYKLTEFLRSNYTELNPYGAVPYFTITKPGTYTIRTGKLSYSNEMPTATDSCAYEYTYTIYEDDLKTDFNLDRDLTAAYRCIGITPGSGYLQVKVKNGSGGPYSYELLQKNAVGVYQSIETNSTGVFDSWTPVNTDPIEGDEYKIKVIDSGCATVRTFDQNIKMTNLEDSPIAWSETETRLCVGGTIKLNALALGSDDYEWKFIGTTGLVWTSTDKNPVITNVTPQHSGKYVVKVKAVGCANIEMTDTIEVFVSEPIMYWNPSAQDGDWFNSNNWLHANGSAVVAGIYPSGCTSVHIPGNADHYPNLSDASSPITTPSGAIRGLPICDTIIYHYGSETTYPTRLRYTGAKVQYNFGYYGVGTPTDGSQPTLNNDVNYPNNGGKTITRIPRGQWMMTAAPLKYMTSGDFSLGGYPNTFQRLYNIANPATTNVDSKNFTNPFETYGIDLGATNNALAIAVVPYKNRATGAGDQSSLEQLKGVIEVPFILNDAEKPMRPLHNYSAANQTSTFTYYDFETLAPIASKKDVIARDEKAYRFVFEQYDDKAETILESGEDISIYRMSLATPALGTKVMIGNPLMSHIDFDQLYTQNKAIIKDYYQVVEANTGDTLTYTLGGATDPRISKDIAPLQAFIVERMNTAAGQSLIFYLEGSKAVITSSIGDAALPKPKSLVDNSTQSWIRVESTTIDHVTNKSVKDIARILFNNKDGKSVPKAIESTNLDQKAEIFLMDQGHKMYSKLVQESAKGTKKYTLGVFSEYSGIVTLNFNVGGSSIKSAKLIDTHLNQIIDITNGGSYEFKNRLDWFFGGRPGMDMNRFQLEVTFK